MAYPTGREISEALLLFILDNGGASRQVPSDRTYTPLADLFKLTQAERTISRDQYYGHSDGRDEPAWNNMVQYARRQLANQHLLDRSRTGHWKPNEAGVSRALALTRR